MEVIVEMVSDSKQEVEIRFARDTSVWKVLPFSMIESAASPLLGPWTGPPTAPVEKPQPEATVPEDPSRAKSIDEEARKEQDPSRDKSADEGARTEKDGAGRASNLAAAADDSSTKDPDTGRRGSKSRSRSPKPKPR